MDDLTKAQEKMYYLIKDNIETNGYSPSLRELAKLNNSSVSAIQFHLIRLRKKGYINYIDGKNRTLTILK